MTPEKLVLLREWMREEIDFAIRKNNSYFEDSMSTWDGNGKRADELFYKVVQAFCGTD